MTDTSLIASTGDIAPENARDGWTGNSYVDDFKGISQAIESGNGTVRPFVGVLRWFQRHGLRAPSV
jgi:hypothetical protein